eukprot:TRINITY_DN932_c0_g2_i1.p2 TRINITY_DN932_c0_g2~~TRINITY_DN932_c0_g2_i1.p2  ORF type:complete len:158 (-),score=30.18 TRINITY_DN932_c0_g2_i1:98-571(-)
MALRRLVLRGLDLLGVDVSSSTYGGEHRSVAQFMRFAPRSLDLHESSSISNRRSLVPLYVVYRPQHLDAYQQTSQEATMPSMQAILRDPMMRMAGHSHWANIKRQKSVADIKRANVFMKLSKEISSAARAGGSDPQSNAKLAAAIDRARYNNTTTTK